MGDTATGEDLLLRAVAEGNLYFNKALEVYVYATVLSGNEGIKAKVSEALVAKYPAFEFDFKVVDMPESEVE